MWTLFRLVHTRTQRSLGFREGTRNSVANSGLNEHDTPWLHSVDHRVLRGSRLERCDESSLQKVEHVSDSEGENAGSCSFGSRDSQRVRPE